MALFPFSGGERRGLPAPPTSSNENVSLYPLSLEGLPTETGRFIEFITAGDWEEEELLLLIGERAEERVLLLLLLLLLFLEAPLGCDRGEE